MPEERWVRVGAGRGIRTELITDLVENSCGLVRDPLPAKDQPDDA